jgi:predicted DNA binding protein
LEFFENIFCKRLRSSKVWLLLLSSTPTRGNKVLVVYDSATGEKNVIRQPRNSQSLEFETVEVISRDSVSLSADLKNEYLCSSSVAIILVSGCLPNNAWAASLVTLSSPMDKIMLYLFLPLLFRFRAS